MVKTAKELSEFLLKNYEPNEDICWQVWAIEDFGDNVNLEDWKVAANKFNYKYESDEGQYIQIYIDDAEEKRKNADSKLEVSKVRKLKM